MNLRHMEVFRAVMLTGSVAGAAELLHVSQPAVSKLLAHAARQSGLTLFERVKGRLVPTPEAQQLHAEIENLWRGVERVRDVSRTLARPETGTLRLAVSASLASHLAPRAVALLYERFPLLKSRIEVLVSPIMVDALLDHSADLAIGLLPNEHPNLVTVKSYACGLACVMREDHPLASKAMVTPSDLRGQRVITSPAGTPYGQSLHRAYGKAAPQLRLDIEVRSSTTACWFAQAGAGIAVIDRAAVAGQSFTGLAVRPFKSSERLEVRIIRNRYRPMSVVQGAFCEAFNRVWDEALKAPPPPRIQR
ncbi:LysR substrate-binding domain-containing protein [Variovorax sp. DT-64]|uniref:LysR substrate-binding domain-containing protein n=1 Tax=Variovorax sp. DT-64 TaxID=3396160 RepID=UPI003F1CA48C